MGFLVVYNDRETGMKTWKITLAASCIGSAAGLAAWAFGIGQKIWPAHPQMAVFLLTLVTTTLIEFTWPRQAEVKPDNQ